MSNTRFNGHVVKVLSDKGHAFVVRDVDHPKITATTSAPGFGST